MELTSAPTEAPGPGPGPGPVPDPVATSMALPVLHFLGLDGGTEAPELMVPRSEVFSSSWEGGSDWEDFPSRTAQTFGDGAGEVVGPLGGVGSLATKEPRCSFLTLGMRSKTLPLPFLSPAGAGGTGWWCSFGPGISFLAKTASRSSSELLGCGFSLDFFLLRLAAAKMEVTRSSRLHESLPEPHEPCGAGNQDREKMTRLPLRLPSGIRSKSQSSQTNTYL